MTQPSDSKATWRKIIFPQGMPGAGDMRGEESAPIPLGTELPSPPESSDRISTDGTFYDPMEPTAYSLHRLIGKGGFGEVWEGTQCSLGRTVAVKRMRPDLNRRLSSDSTSARRLESSFRKEALIMASLEHPNIVPIHDLGLDEEGRPLIAMKLVRGQPWDQLIRADFQLPVGEFLARHLPILVGVTQAVAFAHSRGVIHRDLKPSQIMVGEFGEIQLMDWGIAVTMEEIRRMRDEMARQEAQGEPAPDHNPAPTGTAAFMSPEQTEPTIVNVGPWTDVFLLGGSLYFLLTGRVPYGAEDSRVAFAQARAAELIPPRQRNPYREVPQELEDLVMAAMAPKIRDRITSAEEFLEGLKDYLWGVSRRRESQAMVDRAEEMLHADAATYEELEECHSALDRAAQLWADNRRIGQLRDEAALRYAARALTNGDLVLARLQAERVTPGPARDQVMQQVRALEDQKRAEAREREQALRQAKDLVNFILMDLHDGLESIGRLDLLAKVANKALEHFNSFPETDRSEDVQRTRMLTLRQIGDVMRNQGRLAEAHHVLRQAVEIAEAQVAECSNLFSWWVALSDLYEALAHITYDQGQLNENMDWNRRALVIRQSIMEEEPGNPIWRSRFALSLHHLSVTCWRKGHQDESLELEDRAILIWQELLSSDPSNSEDRRQLAMALNSKAWILRATGNLQGAVEVLHRSLDLRRELADREPGNLNMRADVGWTLRSLALMASDLENFFDALGFQSESMEICRRLVEADPTNPRRQMDLAFSLGGLARIQRSLGDPAAAEVSFLEAIDLQELTALDPSNARVRREEAYNLVGLSQVLEDQGRSDQAEEAARRALQIALDLRSRITGANPAIEELEGRALVQLGRVIRSLGDEAEARAAWEEAVGKLRALFGSDGTQEHPAVQEEPLALALMYLGKVDEARPIVARLVAKGWRGRDFLAAAARVGLYTRAEEKADPLAPTP